MKDTLFQSDEICLNIKELKKYFPIQKGFFRRVVGHVRAVDDVNFFIKKGETLGLVGESGSGKTTVGRCITRLYEPTEGSMDYIHGADVVDLAKLNNKELKPIRKNIQMIFQDPYSSLHPRMTVGQIIAEPLIIHGVGGSKDERMELVGQILEKVGLSRSQISRYPHQFSGGQRQRIGVARALILTPELIICDEPVSALDVSVQAQVLNLLADLQQDFNLTYLFVAHDLSVVEYISDRVAVMYLGKIMEVAPSDVLYNRPKHPYTEALLQAIPKRGAAKEGGRTKRVILEGQIPDPSNPPTGCRFHTRCRYVKDVCRKVEPVMMPSDDSGDAFVACFRSEELKLKGY
jgi:oligopeptide/dipeptide ABC transporter ATP-binding protein